MPLQILIMLAGLAAERGGSALLRKLVTGGASSVTGKLAQGAAARASGSALGKAIDSGLSGVRSGLPGWAADRMNVGSLASNATQLAGLTAKTGMMIGGTEAALGAMEYLGSPGEDRTMDGWERFQGQLNPGQASNALSIANVNDRAQQDHLERALRQIVAAQQESQNRYGGLL
jgi:hypothetical protein